MSVSGQDIEIDVREGPDSLKTRRCRAMLMPDGRVGVVWRGLVYPVRDGNQIDIGGEALPPAICRAGTAPPFPDSGFASIEGDGEAHLLLAGPASAREEATASLRAAGIAILRTGRYLGDPIDSFAADWFIRIEKPPAEEPLDHLLAQVLGRRACARESRGRDTIRGTASATARRTRTARGREAALRSELAAARATVRTPTIADATDTLSPELANAHKLREVAKAGRIAAEAALADAH